MFLSVDPATLSLPILAHLCMSGSRRRLDFDYKVYHSTGTKVPVDRGGRMTTPDINTQAINIDSDVEDLFESYNIENLIDEEELADYIAKVAETKRIYRRIHSQLKKLDDKFTENYPNYEKNLKKLQEKFTEANNKLIKLRKDSKQKIDDAEKLRHDLETEKLKEEMLALRKTSDAKRELVKYDWESCIRQANWAMEDCKWGTFSNVDGVERSIYCLQSHLEKICKAFSEVHSVYDTDAKDLGFVTTNDLTVKCIRDFIKVGRARLIAIDSEQQLAHKAQLQQEAYERDLLEQQRATQQQHEEKIKIDNLLVCAQSLEFEIQKRYNSLKTKFKIDLTKLSDYEILDLKKREDSISTELREILDKISSLIQYVVPCGNAAIGIRDNVITIRDDISLCTEDFLKNVQSTIVDRDISEKKLKNSAGLNIQLPKFKGYQSEMSIYTFRTEFKKLIEPNVQKSLLADYLKKNCLSGAAHNLVSGMEDVDLIWTKLTEVYGDTQLLLQNKIGSLGKFSNLEKLQDDEKIAFTLSSILNVMNDLCKLAVEYDLEADLYHGGGLQKILDLIGKYRERKFIKSTAKENLKNKAKWGKLVDFLKAELHEREAYILNEKSKRSLNLDKKNPKKEPLDNDKPKSTFLGKAEPTPEKCSCHICGKDTDHVQSLDSNKKPYIDYVACKTFVEKTPKDRDFLLFKKRLCNKCLKPGAKFGSKHNCDKQYTCGQKFLKKDDTEALCEKHVLVCGHHCDLDANKQLLEKYKQNVIQTNGKFVEFTKSVSISCFVETYTVNTTFGCNPEYSDVTDHGVFAFQTIDVSGVKLNIFYDSGCGDLVVRKGAADKLKRIDRAVNFHPKPITLDGVNNQSSVCKHGLYSIVLPLRNGNEAKMSGVCVDDITLPFPKYQLSIVEQDIIRHVNNTDPELLTKLPELPAEVGGVVDIMIGKDYLRYFPREVTRLDSGLTLYQSMFLSEDGTSGVVSGPHPEFSKTERKCHFASDRKLSYYSSEMSSYLKYRSNIDQIPLTGKEKSLVDSDLAQLFPRDSCTNDEILSSDSHSVTTFLEKGSFECEYDDLPVVGRERETSTTSDPIECDRCKMCCCVTRHSQPAYSSDVNLSRAPKCLKTFEQVENSGTNISYRCVKCRNCNDCKKGALIEEISIREEYEQDLIDRSVTLDPVEHTATAVLPFLEDPELKLANNVGTSRKVYDGVLRALAKSPEDRKAVLEAEAKLQSLGFVEWLDDLPEEDKKIIKESKVQYYIPWRAVWSDSVTTPCRPVFDGSMRYPGGSPLNEILAKGTNNMNNLQEIQIRWFGKLHAYHTDISKCYNGVKLHKSHWCYQLYLFDEDLDPSKEPRTKVIKTCIYGIKSSGNQAERAIRLTAETYADEFPKANDILHNDLYVDDCHAGDHTEEERDDSCEQVKQCLSKSGFLLKGITFSGQDPDGKLSKDGKSVSVGGLKWFPREDYIMLSVGDFTRKLRGRKLKNLSDDPKNLTMLDCVSMVAQIFDSTGKITPLTAGFKLDVSNLHRSGLKWDDQIPENLRSLWSSNIEMIKEIKHLKYKRAVVPIDAKNLNVVTIDTGDSSPNLICAAIYIRFEKKDGTFSCQLIFARSKVLPEGTTIPRGELMAAVMNAATGHTVKKAFGEMHQKCFKLTDSTVALHWIANDQKVLKTFCRTRVIECKRLAPVDRWFKVDSEDMIADIGTRKLNDVKLVDQDSTWINALLWMRGPEAEFPIYTVDEINPSQKDLVEANKEMLVVKTFHSHQNAVVDYEEDQQIQLRYEFSNYLINPCRFRFRKVVRITGLVLTFVWKLSKRVPRIRENRVFKHLPPGGLADVFKSTSHDRYLVTSLLVSNMGPNKCPGGKVIEVSDQMLQWAMSYFSFVASEELKQFLDKKRYVNITKDIGGILYYSGRILEDYQFGGYPDLCGAALDLCSTTFCVPVMDQCSPVAIAIALEIHWHHLDVNHKGIETMYRQMQRIAHIIGGRKLAVSIKDGCKRCRALSKKSIDVAMGPIQDVNLCIAPAFYACQIDIFGPFKTYSSANKRATLKVWFLIFCCTTTGAIDIRAMEDYSTDSVVLAYIRMSCRYGYPKYVLPDAGSQLLKSCEDMRYSFTDTKHRLSEEFGTDYSPCPVGAHYMHGKVERKIREVKRSVEINVQNERLSLIQWETLMHQISNSINNLPIGLKNLTQDLENLDLITPNRLILGRNNDRSPNAPLTICNDHKRLIETNANIFRAWFKAWIISYVPTIIDRPKWYKTNGKIQIGDIVLFLKNEKEFDELYQYGRVKSIITGKDGNVRKVDVEYKNPTENTFRVTRRGVRELIIIFPVDELDIYERLDRLV